VQEPPQSPKDLSEAPGDSKVRKIFRSSSGINTLSWCFDSTEDISESGTDSESESSEEKSEDEPQPEAVVVGTKKITVKRIESGEKAWWMQSNSEIPQSIAKMSSKSSLSNRVEPQRSSSNIPECVQRVESKASIGEEQCAQVYRIRSQKSGDKARWLQSTEDVPVAMQTSGSSASLSRRDSERKASHRKYKIRHVESGEKAWWMQSSDNIPGGVKRTSSKASSLSLPRNESCKSVASPENQDKKYKIRHVESGESAWWMQSNDNISEGVKRSGSKASSKGLQRNESARSVASSDPRYQMRHVESGDASFWPQDDNEGVKRTESFRSHTGSLKRNESNRSLSRNRLSQAESGDLTAFSNGSLKRSGSIRSRLKGIKRIESGERAWWMEDSNDNVPEGIAVLTPDPEEERVQEEEEESLSEEENEALQPLAEVEEKKPRWNLIPSDSGEAPWWMDKHAPVPEGITQLTPSESEEETEDEESNDDEPQAELNPKFPLVLGDRTSPDGLEMPGQRRFPFCGRESPYENVEWLGVKMFIGDTTNIDDILGDVEPLAIPPAADKPEVANVVQEVQTAKGE
jgi:hypothetical protein